MLVYAQFLEFEHISTRDGFLIVHDRPAAGVTGLRPGYSLQLSVRVKHDHKGDAVRWAMLRVRGGY